MFSRHVGGRRVNIHAQEEFELVTTEILKIASDS
jgi:hypothetical protein